MSARADLSALTLFGSAAAGAGILAYLTTVHYAGVPLACPTGAVVNCATVVTSSYSIVPGTEVPVTVPGMVWFAISGALALFAITRRRSGRSEPVWLRPAHVVWALLAMIAVLYLVYAEISLRALCEWCTAVHLLVLASLLTAIARWQQGQPVKDQGPNRPHATKASRAR